jgi:hypothetical protein
VPVTTFYLNGGFALVMLVKDILPYYFYASKDILSLTNITKASLTYGTMFLLIDAQHHNNDSFDNMFGSPVNVEVPLYL